MFVFLFVCVPPPLAPLSPPTAGFEGCSMVPSIYPLETLHNSLSLKQVDEFLNTVCESSSEAHVKTMKGRRTTQSHGLADKLLSEFETFARVRL